jgi:hypothetical protein
MGEVGKGVRLGKPKPVEPPEQLNEGTVIGVERGPGRVVPTRGFAPVVANDEWLPEDHTASRWCIRPGGLLPRLHRPEHFLMFDPTLPRYRRCSRCGQTIYLYRVRG